MVRAAKTGAKDTRGVEIDHAFAERTTFIVTPDGKVLATIGGLTPAQNVAKALEVIRTMTDDKSGELPSVSPMQR